MLQNESEAWGPGRRETESRKQLAEGHLYMPAALRHAGVRHAGVRHHACANRHRLLWPFPPEHGFPGLPVLDARRSDYSGPLMLRVELAPYNGT